MEMHSPATAKRMWSYLRAVFFMVRKGILSKRKLLVGMHLMMKRRNKAVARSFANLLSHHDHHGHDLTTSFALRREYEFSCSNSPSPAAFSHRGGSASRRRLAYFPCLGAEVEEPDVATPAATALRRIEYYCYSPAPSSPGLLLQDFAPGEECTSGRSPAPSFSVRVSDYSSEEEGEHGGGGGSEAVDDEAEEFIRRFYEQLRRQNQIALLPYLESV